MRDHTSLIFSESPADPVSVQMFQNRENFVNQLLSESLMLDAYCIIEYPKTLYR